MYENLDRGWLRENNPGWDAAMAADMNIKQTEDAHEGSTAFAEKRPPIWKNRKVRQQEPGNEAAGTFAAMSPPPPRINAQAPQWRHSRGVA